MFVANFGMDRWNGAVEKHTIIAAAPDAVRPRPKRMRSQRGVHGRTAYPEYPAAQAKPEPRTREGYKRQYVLSGHMRADHRNTRRRRQTVTRFPLHASTCFDAWRMRD